MTATASKPKLTKKTARFKDAKRRLAKINDTISSVPERKKLVFFTARGEWIPTNCVIQR